MVVRAGGGEGVVLLTSNGGEAWDAVKHPVMHRTVPTTKNFWPEVAVVLKLKNYFRQNKHSIMYMNATIYKHAKSVDLSMVGFSVCVCVCVLYLSLCYIIVCVEYRLLEY